MIVRLMLECVGIFVALIGYIRWRKWINHAALESVKWAYNFLTGPKFCKVAETFCNDSQAILIDVLKWGAKEFGFRYHDGIIKRFAYISDVTFYSSAPILIDASPALKSLSAETSKILSEIWQEPINYEAIDLKIGHDPLSRKYGIAPFTIARKGDAKFSEDRYFSEAPLPTDLHWELLEKFERDISVENKS